jgi:predicted alpha/beta hydrolase family esterase
MNNSYRSHKNPVNLIMHAIGIPLIIAAIPMFGKDWRLAAAMLTAGILIQEIGHSIENSRGR